MHFNNQSKSNGSSDAAWNVDDKDLVEVEREEREWFGPAQVDQAVHTETETHSH